MLAALFLGTMGATSTASETVPTGAASLLPWLQNGKYKGWSAESTTHGSAGPHFGKVRAYLNSTLVASLRDGAKEHPRGAAMVKELYGMGEAVRGWAVALKLEAESAAGTHWYWFEYYDGKLVADTRGAPLCAGCHAAGQDFVLTAWPLK